MIRSYKGVTPTIPASCYVDDSAQIIGDVVLGEHASVWMNAVLRGDVHSIRVGAHSNVQDCSVLHGMKEQYGVFVGEYVTVGHSVTLHGCVIEDRCLIGMGSIILNGARIGAGSIIAAGTLIPEKTIVEPGSLWMGSPGKFRRKLEPRDQESIMRYANNYLGYKESYLRKESSSQHYAGFRRVGLVISSYRFANRIVILSEVAGSRSESAAESKDPCNADSPKLLRGILRRVPCENSLPD